MSTAQPASRGWGALRVYLEMIKIEHSVFALPFAMIGMMWASRELNRTPWPGIQPFICIIVAMVSCRSAAMAYNRMADRDIDEKNPRTKSRALPAGLLQMKQTTLFFYISCVLFFMSCALLNNVALQLSPVALFVTLWYSRTKRFTRFCHFVLGLALGIAPAAAWIGVTGHLALPAIMLTLAVLFWTAGFDIIYALQDEEFDREHGLHSLPEAVGKRKALRVSRRCHVLAIASLCCAGKLVQAGPAWWVGVLVAGAILYYEQSLVSPEDLSRVNVAFFTLNGFVSLSLFVFALADQLLRPI